MTLNYSWQALKETKYQSALEQRYSMAGGGENSIIEHKVIFGSCNTKVAMFLERNQDLVTKLSGYFSNILPRSETNWSDCNQ